jgi:16S rRNA (guanine527-N7)-methyltransferase
VWEVLDEILAAGQRRGTVGPGSREAHVAHARHFWPDGVPPTARGIDLGSGGGLPGLVLALAHPASTWTLVEVRQARADRLIAAAARLGLADRVDVVCARAEELGRGLWRGSADLVVARSFGPPALVAECAAPVLAVGGQLVVSEPESAADRWPAGPLGKLGLAPGADWSVGEARFRSFRQVALCPPAFPRRQAAIARRPLFP